MLARSRQSLLVAVKFAVLWSRELREVRGSVVVANVIPVMNMVTGKNEIVGMRAIPDEVRPLDHKAPRCGQSSRRMLRCLLFGEHRLDIASSPASLTALPVRVAGATDSTFCAPRFDTAQRMLSATGLEASGRARAVMAVCEARWIASLIDRRNARPASALTLDGGIGHACVY